MSVIMSEPPLAVLASCKPSHRSSAPKNPSSPCVVTASVAKNVGPVGPPLHAPVAPTGPVAPVGPVMPVGPVGVEAVPPGAIIVVRAQLSTCVSKPATCSAHAGDDVGLVTPPYGASGNGESGSGAA